MIDQADITNFFGGGINAAKPSQGNIYTEITNSNVTLFCGGPKFGDMQTGKTVTTKATDCTFGTFFGAGYGGNSYNRFSPTNKTTEVNYDWNTWVNANYTCTYSSDADKNDDQCCPSVCQLPLFLVGNHRKCHFYADRL